MKVKISHSKSGDVMVPSMHDNSMYLTEVVRSPCFLSSFSVLVVAKKYYWMLKIQPVCAGGRCC